MITRLYVDNFKTLVNFELSLGPMNLLLGANGSGKSTILEAFRLIRSFVCEDETAGALFRDDSRCRWEKRDIQTFEIDLGDNGGTYTYKLEIEHESTPRQCHVKNECLLYNGRPLYLSQASQGQLYGDDGAMSSVIATMGVRSMVGAIPSGFGGNTLISRFKKRLERMCVVNIKPDNMRPKSDTEDAWPNADLSNFADWYRHLTLDQTARISDLTKTLQNKVLDGLVSLRLSGGKSRELMADFEATTSGTAPQQPIPYRFDELSDGERSLIALYTLATFVLEGDTLCLDQPESHLALPEIQPWLMRISDATDDGRCQAIIVTHHPMLINLLAAHSGYWLERQSGGPTRVKKITQDEQESSGLPLSELIARGWLYE